VDALGLESRPVFQSPLLGPKGNKEFFIHCISGPSGGVPKAVAGVDLDD
jgi:hypothetical protein